MRLRGIVDGWPIALVLALVTSGCDKEEPRRTTFDVRSSPSTPDLHRAGGPELALVIGPRCSEPGQMEYKGDREEKVFYAVKCLHADFLVGLEPGGKGDVLTCAEADQRGTPCWKKW